MIEENSLNNKLNFTSIMKSTPFDLRPLMLLTLFLLLNNAVSSQAKIQDLFPTDDLYFKSWGWQAALGGNYTIPLFGEQNRTNNLGSDTVTHGRFTPKGQPGMMVEGGAFYLFDNPYVSYADAALRVNWFRGKEDFELATVNADNDTLSSQNGTRSFSQYNVSLRLNANNTIQVNKYGFIQNTLGLNFDYLFAETLTIDPPVFPLEEYGEKFQMQIHYQLAYGFRLDLMHYMIIGLDIPLITLTPWHDGRPTIERFESQYWPLTLSVKVMFLGKSNRPDCKRPPPLDMNKKRKEAKMF